ncbi:MAG: hypothetical protein DRJ69_04210 [Thermoprotei archaeon]|nr:MAG: hypothetical protein DRJ69_04210 [Thermoprotei archaeon]
MKMKLHPVLVLLPSLLIIFSIAYGPFLLTIYYSTLFYHLYKPGRIAFRGLYNYVLLFTSQRFLESILKTILFMVVAASIECIIGLFIALLFFKDLPGIKVFRSVVIIPMVVPPVVAALMYRLVLDPISGPISFSLSLIGLHTPEWFGHESALFTMALIDAWQWTPFFFLVFLTGLMNIDKEEMEAADIDGASFPQKLIYIILPHLKQLALIALLIRAIDSFKVFDIIFTLTRGGPGRATEVLSIYIYQQTFESGLIGIGAAASIITFMFLMAIGNFLLRSIVKARIR